MFILYTGVGPIAEGTSKGRPKVEGGQLTMQVVGPDTRAIAPKIIKTIERFLQNNMVSGEPMESVITPSKPENAPCQTRSKCGVTFISVI